MNPETVFSLANGLALLGWISLALVPRRTSHLIAGALIPLGLAIAYASLLGARMGHTQGSFSSLAQVALLFSDPWLLLAGWIHYLAFDLFIGSWEARDAERSGVPRWALTICLFLTFLIGPVGLLAYLGARAFRTRSLAV